MPTKNAEAGAPRGHQPPRPQDLLDRMVQRRADGKWLAASKADPAARFLVLADLKPVIRSNDDRSEARLAWFALDELKQFALPTSDALFLGLDRAGAPHFAIFVPEHMTRHAPGGLEQLRPIVDLRSLAMQGVLSAREFTIAGQARALASWHLDARHCGHCGGTNRIKDGGWKRKCWACGHEWFPRTDPAVIMLITYRDRCLLARHRDIGEMYSTLAGFIEHGEDIENAVRREVHEETGIKVGNVNYFASQPWPFPHSLMIGCAGEALNDEIVIDSDEITDARWFTRDEAAAMIENRHDEGHNVPGPHSIAHWLIQAFVDAKL